MSTTTTNIKLTKPDEGEYYDINIINENSDKIDSSIGKINSDLDKFSEILPYNNISNTILKLNKKQTVKIVCLGDSVTYGYNNTTPYPEILQSHLRYHYDYSDITVVNSGINGATSKYLLDNLTTLVDSYNPDLVILMVGLNDIATHQTDPTNYNLTTFKNNINNILKHICTNGYELCMLTTTPCLGEDRYYQQAYNKAIIELTEKNSIKLVDIYKEFEECTKKRICNAYADIKDWQHPNDSAQIIIFSKLEKDLFDITEINEKSEIPFYRSKYCISDITNFYEDSNIWCGASYRLLKDGSAGTHLHCDFVTNNKSTKVYLNTIKYSDNGTFNVEIDGLSHVVDANSTTVEYDSYVELATVGYGYHTFDVLNTDYVSGNGQIDLVSLKFEILE